MLMLLLVVGLKYKITAVKFSWNSATVSTENYLTINFPKN